MRSDREKADDREIAGPYKELALEIRRLLGYYSDDLPLLSARQAALRCGVNHATISSLISGARASKDSLRRLADGFGGDSSLLMRLAGFPVSDSAIDRSRNSEMLNVGSHDSLPSRIFHKIERLNERDLIRLERLLEVWVDDGHEIGV